MKVVLKNVRLAFPCLFVASGMRGDAEGKAAFSASFIIEVAPGTDPELNTEIKKMRAAIATVAQEKWGAKALSVLDNIYINNKAALHDGKFKNEYVGYAGNFYVSARNVLRPVVIDRDKTPLVETDGKLYAGCYVNASVNIWAQDNTYARRINASLGGVQFVKDGEPFGAAGEDSIAAADDFEVMNGAIEALL